MLPEALPYHLKVRDFFRRQTSTWEFFTAAATRDEQLIAFKTELLKNTYRFSQDSEPALFGKIDRVREQLGLGALPVMAYQAQYAHPGNELNASVIYLHQEAHLVFSGPILERLTEEELLAAIAHELSHVRLYTLLNGDLEVADRIITSIANHRDSEADYRGKGPSAGTSLAPYVETARLFKLYTEIYCDRGAYAVLGDPAPVITMLLKLATGLVTVNADSYSRQAEAIFSAEPGTTSATPTHQENFIRTRALRLWNEQGEAATAAITRMIEGLPDLDRLDLFSRQELSDLTREFLQEYLRPGWIRSTLVTALERQYFPDESPFEGTGDIRSASAVFEQDRNTDAHVVRQSSQLQEAIAGLHPDIRTYLGYVLLDFALADPSLEDMPAGRAFEFAAEMQLSDVYDAICKKELQLNDKKWLQHKQKVQKAYAELPKD
jgi:Zn-dependent protease with chaperone function